MRLAHDLLHPFQGRVAQGGVAGVAGLADQTHRLVHHSLVQSDRAQGGGLPDDGIAPQGAAGLDQGPGAAHGGFLVRRGQEGQGLLQILSLQPACGLHGQGEEGLHVAGAQAVEPAAVLGDGEGVPRPAAGVVGDRIRMARQDQTPWPRAQGGDEVGLVRLVGQFQDLHPVTGVRQPFRQAVDEVAVAHVQFGLDAAHRGQGDQVLQHGAELGGVAMHGTLQVASRSFAVGV